MSDLTNVFTDIADSIRLKTGGSDTFTPTEMAEAIKYQCDHLVLSAESIIENGELGANVKLVEYSYNAVVQIGLLINKDGTIPPLDRSVPYSDAVKPVIDILDFANSSDIIGTSEDSVIINRILSVSSPFEFRTTIVNDLTSAMWVRGYNKYADRYEYSEPLYIPHCVLRTQLTPTRNTAGTKPAVQVIVYREVNPNYTVINVGFLYSRNNTIPSDATPSEAGLVMTLENSDASNIVRKESAETTNIGGYGLTIVDAQKSETEGYGVWVRGYAIIDYNGTTKTVYNDAQYAKGLPV